MMFNRIALGLVLVLCPASPGIAADDPEHAPMIWVKRHPRPGGQRSSPRLGYEGAYGYDPASKLLIRYGGHNQGGGGEQNSELWTYDLERDLWNLIEPSDAPPGVCCAQQNVFHDALGQFVRFPAFSASHGWQSLREVWLKDSAVWTFDPVTSAWSDMRPLPAPKLRPLRGAAYAPEEELIVVHGGEGAQHGTLAYDLYTNTWHELDPEGGPERGLSQPGFAYDAVNQVFVQFGSQFATDPRTWLYDLAKNQWRVLETRIHPPADKSSPVLAADSRNGIVLASVKGQDGLETWALDVAKAEWRRLDVRFEPEQNDEGADGDRNRVLLYLPDRNFFVMECRTRNEQQIWTFRYAEAAPPPPAPQQLRLSLVGENEVRLQWLPPDENRAWTYNLYRAVDSNPARRKWERIAHQHRTTSYIDRLPAAVVNQPHGYRVVAIDETGKWGLPSRIARTRPPLITDLKLSLNEQGHVRLSWNRPPREIATHVHVERAPVAVYSTDQVLRLRNRLQPTSDLGVGRIRQIGQFERQQDSPLEAAVDEFIQEIDLTNGNARGIASPIYEQALPADQLYGEGKPYRYPVYSYRLIALNRWGHGSGPSPAVFTLPAAVQSVFAREEGETATRLRWKSYPGAKFHVYRHNGRYDTSPVVRLTNDPQPVTQYLDSSAGSETRRYEIVEVDALGQEGMPSQPVWSRREWRRFYVPYTDEWHQ